MSTIEKFNSLMLKIDNNINTIKLIIETNKNILLNEHRKVQHLRRYFNEKQNELNLLILPIETANGSASGSASGSAAIADSSSVDQNQNLRNKEFLEKYPTYEAFNSDPDHPLLSERYYNLWGRSTKRRRTNNRILQSRTVQPGTILSFFGPKKNSRRTTQKNNR
jgi:hypothetical protein